VSKFNIIKIPASQLIRNNKRLEGAIDKYWFYIPDLGRSLVKEDTRGAWVEKITETLAKRIGLPVADCELVEREDGLKAIASPDFLLDGATEVAGEKLLKDALGKNHLYTPDAILSVLDKAGIVLPRDFIPNSQIATASDLMVGYLMFDSWIVNIDRHSKNWGIQLTLDGRKELLPTYDHGLSCGVRMPSDKLPLDLGAFSGSCYSSIQGNIGGTLSMSKLADRLLELKPEAAKFWIGRIGEVESQEIEEIFDRLPIGWIDDIRREFSIGLLAASRERSIALDCTR
jgi:hypothetical protein